MKRTLLITFIIVSLLLSFSVFASAQTTEIKFATILPEDSVLGDAMKYFKELVEERSNGEMEVVNYFGATMGEEKSVLEQLSTNDIQMNAGGSGTIIWHAPEYYITGIPFLFESSEQVEKLMKELIEEEIRDVIIDRMDVRVLGGALRSPRNLITTEKDRKILHPEDVEGMTMRLPEYESWNKGWEAFGAKPQAIAGAEQFDALQMGVVEATENPNNVLYNMRLSELGEYIHLTEHLHSLRIWSISEPFYQSLSAQDQQLIEDCTREALDWMTEENMKADLEFLVKMQEQGLEVVVPARNEFREKVKPVVDELKDDWAPGLYEDYVKPLLEE